MIDPLFSQLYPGQLTEHVTNISQHIKLLICDVDGVFTDGRIYLGNDGEELKAFNTRDGYGIKAIQTAGITVAVITGRHSTLVEQRMASLNIKYLFMGQEDKTSAYQQLRSSLKIDPQHIAYIGDDSPDLPVMKEVGLSISVHDGHPYIRQNCDYITTLAGGFGAVREVCDLLLIAQQKFNLYYGSRS